MSSATRIINGVRGLREEADFEPEEADAIGVAAAEVAEAAADRMADRMLIRLGAWTLASCWASSASRRQSSSP
ncbi:MAG: hypothetical protein F4Z08_07280 [Chloroflexi bacterium]|nr:hypothetical protein [Chloroflexota bacterium]